MTNETTTNTVKRGPAIVAGIKRQGKTSKVKLGYCGATKTITLFVAFNQACVGCDESLNYLTYQIDHLIPQSHYKAIGVPVNNDYSNLCVLCPNCNREKGTKTALQFFGQNRLDVIKAYQDNIPNLLDSDIEFAAREASQLSKRFCAKYKGGKWLKNFWKD